MKLVIGEFRWIFGGSSTSGNVLTSRELQIQQSLVKRFFPFTFELWRVQVLYQENNGSVTTDESRNRQTGNTNRIRYYSSRKTFLMWCIRFGMPRFTSENLGSRHSKSTFYNKEYKPILFFVFTQVLSGDSVIIRGQPRGGPPPERQLCLSNVNAPKLARRSNPNVEGSVETRDEVLYGYILQCPTFFEIFLPWVCFSPF